MTCILLSLVACNEDFLNRVPEDAISDATFFNSANDFKVFMNGRYNGIIRNAGGNNPLNLENGSDNLLAQTPSSDLMQLSNSGQAPATNANWNKSYDLIRSFNYLLDNQRKNPSIYKEAKHYIGEAFYGRAFTYFTLLQLFGGVPYIDKVLSTDSPELFATRESRDFIANKIIQDLDSAIICLDWKGIGAAKAGRINKESALLMKTRVGLYEGSWEYYHGIKNTPFKVEGKDGKSFLNMAVVAGDVLIAYCGNKIYKTGIEPYKDLFNRQDYNTIDGAFLYKAFDASQNVYMDARPTFTSFMSGMTNNAVYSYLMKDGKPDGISSKVYDYKNQNSLINARDPRLNQTIYAPERGPLNKYYASVSVSENLRGGIYQNVRNQYSGQTGYTILKYGIYMAVSLDITSTDDLILRYEEALLNYAEAKSILGILLQTDIDKTVNLLRDRVGMVRMNMAEVNGWNVTYSKKDGFDPTAPKVLNEIRRERRVELMLDGFRTTDIKRWALYDDVFNGTILVGAYYQELADYWNNLQNVLAAGFSAGQLSQVSLTKGVTADVIGEYLNPLWKNADFKPGGRGYFIDPGRDYLQAIPKNEIQFYKEKANVDLTQNPGWF